jgi:hypothetical protein
MRDRLGPAMIGEETAETTALPVIQLVESRTLFKCVRMILSL